MMPHGHAVPSPVRVAICSMDSPVRSSSSRAISSLARTIQSAGVMPVAAWKRRRNALAHGGARGQIGDPQGLVDTRAQRIEHRGQRTALFLVDRRLHELRLTALAMRRDHQPTRHLVGPGRPVIATQQVQAQIQAAALPADVSSCPSSTYSTSASTWMRGYRLRRASA